MIDDNQVRAKNVQAFLKSDYPKGSLPTVDEAKKRAEDEVQHNRADAFRRSKAKRNIERRIDKYDPADDYQSMCRLSDALRDVGGQTFTA